MNPDFHNMTSLFEQLGLSSSEKDITAFISSHRLEGDTPLAEASFWSDPQAAFLRESIAEDADWAEVVDELSALLRV